MTLTQQAEQQKMVEMMMRNIKDFGKYSYEQEETRERSLLDQAGKMLTAFALFTAALNMLLSAVLTHATIPISKNKLIFLGGAISLVLLASLVLAIMAQWRYKYKVLQDGQTWFNHVYANYQSYSTQADFDKAWMEQIKEIHDAKTKSNDRRVKLIMAAMITFLLAVLLVILAIAFVFIRFYA